MKLTTKQQAAIGRLLKKFETGDVGELVQVAHFKPDVNSPARNRSIGNRLLSAFTCGSVDGRTYKQWGSVGRQVRKGSESGVILAPINVKNEDDDTYRLVGFRAVAVFSFEQTDPIENFDGEVYGGELQPNELPPLTSVAAALGVDYTYAPIAGAYGSYSPTTKTIRLATTDEATWFHELAHAVHHHLAGDIKAGPDVEVVADFTANVLMEVYGLRNDTANTYRYIQHYAGDVVAAVKAVMTTVTEILDFINNVEATE